MRQCMQSKGAEFREHPLCPPSAPYQLEGAQGRGGCGVLTDTATHNVPRSSGTGKQPLLARVANESWGLGVKTGERETC